MTALILLLVGLVLGMFLVVVAETLHEFRRSNHRGDEPVFEETLEEFRRAGRDLPS